MNRVTRFTSWAVVAALAVGAASVNAQDLQTMSKNANQWVMTGRTYDLLHRQRELRLEPCLQLRDERAVSDLG